MNDSYQAVYDAVRSRIGNGDVGQAVADVARQSFDISFAVQVIVQDFGIAANDVANAMQRPSVLFRPKLMREGGKWCMLYGANLQEGVAGFGDTPELAAQDFDTQWRTR